MDDPVSILAAVGAVAIASQLFQGSVKVLKEGEAQHTPAEYKSEAAYKKLSAPYASSDRCALAPEFLLLLVPCVFIAQGQRGRIDLSLSSLYTHCLQQKGHGTAPRPGSQEPGE